MIELFSTDTYKKGLQYKVTLEYPTSLIWEFLTNPDKMRLWMTPDNSIVTTEKELGTGSEIAFFTVRNKKYRSNITEFYQAAWITFSVTQENHIKTVYTYSLRVGQSNNSTLLALDAVSTIPKKRLYGLINLARLTLHMPMIKTQEHKKLAKLKKAVLQ